MFSCPGQLNRWRCQWVCESVIFWFLTTMTIMTTRTTMISMTIMTIMTTWTAFAILAMFWTWQSRLNHYHNFLGCLNCALTDQQNLTTSKNIHLKLWGCSRVVFPPQLWHEPAAWWMKQGEGDRCCQYAGVEFKELEFGILTFGFWDICQRISSWWMKQGEGDRCCQYAEFEFKELEFWNLGFWPLDFGTFAKELVSDGWNRERGLLLSICWIWI